MAEPFIAEIRIFAGNFAPRGWAYCDGQLLPISQNTALFSIVGTIYGGDGETTLGLPNIQDRVPVHAGTGPGLTRVREGQRGGSPTHTLNEQQMPNHHHGPTAVSSGAGTTGTPAADKVLAAGVKAFGAVADLADIGKSVGGGQPHNNEQPVLSMGYIIALTGLFPSRN